MRITLRKSVAPAFLFAIVTLAFGAEPSTPPIPKMWDDAALAALELPLAQPAYSPKQISAEFYYRMSVRPIYRSYPVYHPAQEPPGYIEGLLRREPEILWDDKGRVPTLKTDADWLRAGEMVFDSAIFTGDGHIVPSPKSENFLRDPAWYKSTGTPVTRDGVVPFYSYIIRERGKLEIGSFSCAACHTRVMPGGTALKGAQGSYPLDRILAHEYRAKPESLPLHRALERLLYHTPWLQPDPQANLDRATAEQQAPWYEAVPPGALTRHRLRAGQPVQVPDLIGVQGRRYLDRSGLQRHRDIADLMRYAALNQGADNLATFGDFVPLTAMTGGQPLPADPRQAPPGLFERYSDEQLFALARYLYALKPPPNPHPSNALAARGREIFRTEGCAKCHDPAQGYTNNKLVAAPGFTVPANHPEKAAIMRERVGTDPALTLTTRRGTGLYKIPSLLGVWYRGPFEHNGSVATLEDWFDPRRLEDSYVPTGWKGPPGTKARAVKGHEFGLDLASDERVALIAFLKTL